MVVNSLKADCEDQNTGNEVENLTESDIQKHFNAHPKQICYVKVRTLVGNTCGPNTGMSLSIENP